MATIDELKEKYDGEWLAIRVLKEDRSRPQEGELLHHSMSEDEVWSVVKGDRTRIYVTYAGPPLPEGVGGCIL